LQWSDEVARFAAEWAARLQANGCSLEHRPFQGKFAQRYGENLYFVMGQRAAARQVVDSWVSEARDYDPKTGRCRAVCGHFTQVVWRNSRRLGCAVATCGDAQAVVCNYDPPGNFVGQRPF
jgi:hypothetical protein